MDNENLIVAIDGPSGTGKSITAQLLAEKLGFRYIDSGSYYRAVTYYVLINNIKLNDKPNRWTNLFVCSSNHKLRLLAHLPQPQY